VSAPAVVLLHGFTHTGASWEPVVRALGERYLAIAPDIRGHGSATEAVPVGLAEVAADVAAVAPADGGFTLVGYSMGGRIALHVALAASVAGAASGGPVGSVAGAASGGPVGSVGGRELGAGSLAGRIERLVLIGASPGIADAPERAARRAADDRLADEIEATPDIATVARRWASSTPVLAGQPARVGEWVDAIRRQNTPAGLAAALRGLGTGVLPSLWDRLEELAMPVTLVVGERDFKFRGIAGEMAARIGQAEVVVVPGAGHAVHLEDPAAVARVIGGG
jgi:2-succinyl-6-hydroxy-2,4-cyclohexadiene-1-carboxylate synthase